ncbi:MAG: TylF/MycF/NovP-related O-methyltransferase [Candidatus Hodarchaeota archaeon]
MPKLFDNLKENKIIKFIINKIRYISNSLSKNLIQNPTYDYNIHKFLISHEDPIRYATIALAITKIIKKKINGSFAEIGVYKGHASKIIHSIAPYKTLYLFDTFEGFPLKFLKTEDKRFQDTNETVLKKTIGDLENIVIKKGIFPETTKGLENEKFSFVLIDLDLYEPTLAALEFFYSRINPGGYIFIHDYNNPHESERGVYKAVNKFFIGKLEKIIELPDKWGSALIRKI